MRGVLAGLMLAAVLGGASQATSAPVVSSHPERVTVTIYPAISQRTASFYEEGFRDQALENGVALIGETRTLDLPAGDSVIRFEDVSEGMLPQTARLGGLPAQPTEQNFDYDLLSPGSLLEKSVGHTVSLVRTDAKTGKSVERRAVVRSGAQGVMLQTADGLEALGCGGVDERLVFDRMPEGLSERPTLSMRVHAPAAGRYVLRLAYISSGLAWSADYVARLRPDGKTLDLSGWITLANTTATSFRQAHTEVVAGRMALAGDHAAPKSELIERQDGCWADPRAIAIPMLQPIPAASPIVQLDARAGLVEEVVVTGSRIDPRNLGDLKLYPLPEPTTVAAHQTKQVQFLDQQAVPYARVHRFGINLNGDGSDFYDNRSEIAHPVILLRLKNTVAAKLGKPLPTGWVGLRVPTSAGPMAAGEYHLRDTPVGAPIEINPSDTEAMDIGIRRRVLKSSASGPDDARTYRTTVEVQVTSAKREPAQVELIESPPGRSARVLGESVAHRTEHGAFLWPLTLKGGETRTLRFTLTWTD